MRTKSLSVFIPVFNEEKIIDENLGAVLRTLEEAAEDFELIIIDDGSTDGSRMKLQQWAARCPRIKLLQHKTNLGYGAALSAGFKNASKELVFYTDMDLPVDLEELKKILPLMDSFDLVIGWRLQRFDTPRRFIYFKVYKFLIRLLFGLKVRDINFSFKCIRRSALKGIELSARTGFIDAQLLIGAKARGIQIKEVPIVYRPRKYGVSKFDNFGVAWGTAREILFYWLKGRGRKKEPAVSAA